MTSGIMNRSELPAQRLGDQHCCLTAKRFLVQTPAGAFLHGVCMFSHTRVGFSVCGPGIPCENVKKKTGSQCDIDYFLLQRPPLCSRGKIKMTSLTCFVIPLCTTRGSLHSVFYQRLTHELSYGMLLLCGQKWCCFIECL